ncbi:PilZ domain-containing protein [Desulfolithobacter sp.]
MNTDLRRSKRDRVYLPISVSAQDGISGERLAGPFSSRIIDISLHGACLLMTQVMCGSYHIFHTTRENDSSLLLLHIDIPPEIVNLALPARPVWLDIYHQDQIRAFKMGVEFLTSPDGEQMKRLQRLMRQYRRSKEML